jgi:hypothetical protein
MGVKPYVPGIPFQSRQLIDLVVIRQRLVHHDVAVFCFCNKGCTAAGHVLLAEPKVSLPGGSENAMSETLHSTCCA